MFVGTLVCFSISVYNLYHLCLGHECDIPQNWFMCGLQGKIMRYAPRPLKEYVIFSLKLVDFCTVLTQKTQKYFFINCKIYLRFLNINANYVHKIQI